ncbi:MAG: M56 family metallopeptidase [Pseudomonadota bacterium]
MTAMKAVLDVIVDANVVLILAFCLWRLIQAAIVRSQLRTDYVLQLRLLRTVLIFVVLSPLLSYVVVTASLSLWPKTPVTVSDLIVASYLRGDIGIPALQFEALLNTRSRIFEAVLAGDLPWLTAVLWAVVFGSGVLFLRSAVVILHIQRLVADSHLWRRTRSTDIRLSDTASVPFVARGIFRRHVVLPSSLVTKPRDMRIVIAHEFEHVRQGDAEWELAFALLRPLFFLNPAFLLWNRAFGKLRELNSDQAVLERVRVSPQDYARCLLDFCGRAARARTASIVNVPFIQVGSHAARAALEARMLALRDARDQRSTPIIVVCFSAVLAVGVVLSAASVRNPGDWSQDRLMLSTIVNLERSRSLGLLLPLASPAAEPVSIARQ